MLRQGFETWMIEEHTTRNIEAGMDALRRAKIKIDSKRNAKKRIGITNVEIMIEERLPKKVVRLIPIENENKGLPKFLDLEQKKSKNVRGVSDEHYSNRGNILVAFPVPSQDGHPNSCSAAKQTFRHLN